MPIRQVDARAFAPIRGKIRLGLKEEVRPGVSKPVNVEYFVLTDAPDVAEVYGKQPDEIDIVFPTDDVDRIIPTWYKLYAGGQRRSDGTTTPGRLLCRGDGPDNDGMPGTAVHYAKRDPITGIVPTRECHGQNCPDYRNAKGFQTCFQSMQVMCFIPRVSMMGVYLISTRSWHSIQSFTNMVHWMRTVRGGQLKGCPAKIVRRKREIWVKDGGKEFQRTHFIMELEANEDFYDRHGDEIKQIVGRILANPLILPDKEEVLALPSPSAFVPDEESEQAYAEERVQTAEALLTDADVVDGFAWLQGQIMKTYSDKQRLIFIRRLEGGSVDLKAAVIARIREVAAEHRQFEQAQAEKAGKGPIVDPQAAEPHTEVPPSAPAPATADPVTEAAEGGVY